MATKPTILIVPGSFCEPTFYTPLISALNNKGIPTKGLWLKSATKKPGLPTMADDAASIAADIEKEVDQGKDVVLVAHSYGGVPASQAVEGLVKSKREKEGKKGGVVRLAYVTALVPSEGGAAAGVLSDGSSPANSYMTIDEDGWMQLTDLSGVALYVFNDLSPEEGLKQAAKFTSHSSASFAGELTYAGYKDVPVSYLFCENDTCVPPKGQQNGLDSIEATGRKPDVTRINSDHVPFVSHPDEVLNWFVKLAELGGKE
ncbi:alpha/beta-hydrolase [Polyplosphaeria fusca]|uniref:Alpha/beta-hydrolase n=1 Tax=Polyplosphaeria fusca TaxID=682080 RepID=A0A9P4UZT8_9PLEO|nr:alpha/beta-hydrolase [Polyplosphaeria fusca]